MRLDAVYLVAPKPKPPSVPTRRAFLLAGGMFTAGLGLGGACGYAVGIGQGGQDPAPKLPASSGNAELDELRRLALVAPIEELADQWLYFADVYSTSYRSDQYLVTGIERLVDHVLAHEELEQRQVMATFLAQVIERGEESIASRLGDRVNQLRRTR